MAPFDEALPLIRAAAAEPGGPSADRFEERGPFEALIAVLLARQVGPAICKSVIDALREQGLLDPTRLDDAELPEIQDALRGKVRSISVRTLAPIKHLARWLVEQHGGRAEEFADSGRSTDDLREELAGVRGIGPVAADAILLDVLKRPTYPVDRGTYRILVRHGWLDGSATYDDAARVHRAPGRRGSGRADRPLRRDGGARRALLPGLGPSLRRMPSAWSSTRRRAAGLR